MSLILRRNWQQKTTSARESLLMEVAPVFKTYFNYVPSEPRLVPPNLQNTYRRVGQIGFQQMQKQQRTVATELSTKTHCENTDTSCMPLTGVSH